MQVLHALLEDIRLDFRYSAAAQSSSFAIRSIQVDNQILTSSHPVVLAPSQRGHFSMPTVRTGYPTASDNIEIAGIPQI